MFRLDYIKSYLDHGKRTGTSLKWEKSHTDYTKGKCRWHELVSKCIRNETLGNVL